MSPRLSIIPAGAVTDPALEPRDLQVLCLLGRHTDDQGWCVRSQVKMAKELHCGRATVQRSLDRLYDAGWVMKRRRGGADNEDTQPSYSYAYRVILDRDDSDNDRALRVKHTSDGSANSTPNGGCPSMGTPSDAGEGAHLDGHPGAHPCVGTGAHVCTGTNNDPSERSHLERERDARARATDEFVQKFVATWPTSALDDQRRIAYAAAELTGDEQKAAMDAIGRFLDQTKRFNRRMIAGWTYLEQKRWTLLEQESERAASAFVRVKPEEPPGRAVLTVCTIARASMPFRSGDGHLNYRGQITPQLLALADAPSRDAWPKISDRQQVGAWSNFISRYVTTAHPPLLRDDEGPYLHAPWLWPPRVDGTLCEDGNTGEEVTQ